MKADKTQFSKLVEDISVVVPSLSEDAISYFTNKLEYKFVKRNSFFIKEGEQQRYIGYINKGFVRSFYINDKGKEINNRFLLPGEFATHYSAFVKQDKSKYYFHCLEDTELLCFSYQHIQLCYSQFPAFERYGRIVAEEVFVKYETHLENLLFNKPYDRYMHFINAYPEIYQKVSLSMLASYLGIDRVSLSRIRKKLSRQ